MTRYRYRAVLLLFLLLIFATPAVGQEAGQRARGEIVLGILGSVDPMSMIKGVITPDLQQLEMEDGTIIARDALIDPEYFDSTRPNFLATVLGSGVTVVVLKLILDRGACAGLGTLLPGDNEPGEPGYNECVDSGPSFPAAFGLGAAGGTALWVSFPLWAGEWKPW
jgi:hypothetical protein